MNLNHIKQVYFVGIGGIGMSALARYFKEKKAIVSGYDKTESELTQSLVGEGIPVSYREVLLESDKEAQLVVYTPAVGDDNVLLNWFRENKYEVQKRSVVLQWITDQYTAVTVAGTHGKTTISSMIAFLLRTSAVGCNAFLGGISVNYKTNFWLSEQSDIAVIEADEYDRSFLRLHPSIAVLSAMDADHLDIYGSVEEMEKAFVQYTANIKPDGTLIYKHGLKKESELQGANKLSYSLQNNAADCFAANIQQKEGGYVFDAIGKDWMIAGLRLNIGGMHNVENMIAAIASVKLLGVSNEDIKREVPEYRGVRRRFEYVLKNEDVIFIDDYAHHPEELKTLISSAKRLFNNRKCVIIFQPHLYSRTRDLAEEFAQSLNNADEVILLEIYPAREKPIEGISATTIENKIQVPVTILSKEGVLQYVQSARIPLLITAGAGDIDKLVPQIKEILMNKK